jgi:hypothetical protein
MSVSWQYKVKAHMHKLLSLKSWRKAHVEGDYPLASLCTLYHITTNLGSTNSEINYFMQKKKQKDEKYKMQIYFSLIHTG